MKVIKKTNYAFTLIELIAVIAITSLIASLAIPKIGIYIDKANKTKVIAAVSELNNFIILNEIDNKYEFNDINSILQNYEDLKSLKIDILDDASFKAGRVKGNLEYVNNRVIAKILEPKEFSNEVIE